MLSERVKMLKPSPTLALGALAKDLESQGHDVISLSVGEPDWDTYRNIKDAALQAIEDGFTKYTPVNGILELRKAIAAQTNQDLGTSYDPAQVTVSTGAKFVVFSALQSLINPGDEVVIPAPYWVSYPTMVELAEGKPVIAECGEHEHFKLSPAILRKCLTMKTKALILNSPNNPTGQIYTHDELSALAQVLRDFPRVVVLTDDIYNRLVFNGEGVAPQILQVAPDLGPRTIVINGASKTYSMTGWRIGWALGPKDVIQAMTDYQSQSVSSPSSISQKAALAGLQGSAADVKASLAVLARKRDQFIAALSKISGTKVEPPGGAFYLWIDIHHFLGRSFNGMRLNSSRDFSQALLKDQMVAIVPGVEFGSDGYLRASFVIPEKRIEQAAQRIQEFVAKLT